MLNSKVFNVLNDVISKLNGRASKKIFCFKLNVWFWRFERFL